jgi:hypothetical protein
LPQSWDFAGSPTADLFSDAIGEVVVVFLTPTFGGMEDADGEDVEEQPMWFRVCIVGHCINELGEEAGPVVSGSFGNIAGGVGVAGSLFCFCKDGQQLDDVIGDEVLRGSGVAMVALRVGFG